MAQGELEQIQMDKRRYRDSRGGSSLYISGFFEPLSMINDRYRSHQLERHYDVYCKIGMSIGKAWKQSCSLYRLSNISSDIYVKRHSRLNDVHSRIHNLRQLTLSSSFSTLILWYPVPFSRRSRSHGMGYDRLWGMIVGPSRVFRT